ncbi:MAG: FadR family transcriptional regulator [Actinobacteria bacterium]|nr:FadR family transcriptional regulator [Actinomycetota bacterium]
MRPRKVEDIVATLKLRMQSRVYGRGDRLPAERALAPELGVARSTLRQALAGLEREGYLTRRVGAGGGWFVTDLAQPAAEWQEAMRLRLREVRDIIDYRIAVESRAAELAAVRRTAEQLARMKEIVDRTAEVAPSTDGEPISRALAGELRSLDAEFHALVIEAADSRRVAEAVLAARAELFATETRVTYEHIAAGLPRDHRRVLDAIVQRDADTARVAMEAHIRHGADVWLANGCESEA